MVGRMPFRKKTHEIPLDPVSAYVYNRWANNVVSHTMRNTANGPGSNYDIHPKQETRTVIDMTSIDRSK